MSSGGDDEWTDEENVQFYRSIVGMARPDWSSVDIRVTTTTTSPEPGPASLTAKSKEEVLQHAQQSKIGLALRLAAVLERNHVLDPYHDDDGCPVEFCMKMLTEWFMGTLVLSDSLLCRYEQLGGDELTGGREEEVGGTSDPHYFLPEIVPFLFNLLREELRIHPERSTGISSEKFERMRSNIRDLTIKRPIKRIVNGNRLPQ